MASKSSKAHHPHNFGHTFFGVLSYLGLLGIWLLVLTCIAITGSLTGALSSVSTSIGTTLHTSDTAVLTQSSSSAYSTVAVETGLKFGLFIFLLVLVWIFAYFSAKFGSRILRHLIVLFGQRVSYGSLAAMKYLIAGVGLMGVAILLQFFASDLVAAKLSIALMVFISGVVAIAAIWIQKTLLERHKIPIKHVL